LRSASDLVREAGELRKRKQAEVGRINDGDCADIAWGCQ
jgi:hypothetical protein